MNTIGCIPRYNGFPSVSSGMEAVTQYKATVLILVLKRGCIYRLRELQIMGRLPRYKYNGFPSVIKDSQVL